jgi:acetyl-CoA C-acetyltransferase
MASSQLWLTAGLRTPFAKVDGPLSKRDAISLSVPVVRAMCGRLKGSDRPNIARGITLDTAVGAHIPAFTTIMACATGMVACAPPRIVKELATYPSRSLAIIGICTDGGLGGAGLLFS